MGNKLMSTGKINTVKPAKVVTCIKRSPVLKGHSFFVLKVTS